jgi:hypothetical protein
LGASALFLCMALQTIDRSFRFPRRAGEAPAYILAEFLCREAPHQGRSGGCWETLATQKQWTLKRLDFVYMWSLRGFLLSGLPDHVHTLSH